MSLYISQQQSVYSEPVYYEPLPVLFDNRKGMVKHRIFSPYYKYSHIVLDSYELLNRNLKDIIYPVVPSGCITVAFFLGKTVRSEIWGCNTCLEYVHIPSGVCLYCVRLKPGAMRCFGEIDVSELTDRKQPAEVLLEHTDHLCRQLRYAESFHERNVMIQRFLDMYRVGEFQLPGKVAQCLQMIKETNGTVKINELAEKVLCSSRYINRLFLFYVGIAPKLYCSIVQMYMSLHDVLQYRPKSLLDTAVRWGYFDQAHMNRIYQKFLRKTAYEMKNFAEHDISSMELLLDTDIIKTAQHKQWFIPLE